MYSGATQRTALFQCKLCFISNLLIQLITVNICIEGSDLPHFPMAPREMLHYLDAENIWIFCNWQLTSKLNETWNTSQLSRGHSPPLSSTYTLYRAKQHHLVAEELRFEMSLSPNWFSLEYIRPICWGTDTMSLTLCLVWQTNRTLCCQSDLVPQNTVWLYYSSCFRN